MFGAGAVLGLILGALALAGPAAATNRIWTATGAGDDVVATNCFDCGDDIGMMIRCRGPGQPAEVLVPWLSSERGSENAPTDILVDVDWQQFPLIGSTSYLGAVGYFPRFDLVYGDPLVEALRAGQLVRIYWQGSQTAVGLTGSRRAIDAFDRQCRWDQIAPFPSGTPVLRNGTGSQQPRFGGTGTQQQPRFGGTGTSRLGSETAQGNGAAAQAPKGAVWSSYAFMDPNTGRPMLSLAFGVPETDAIALVARCQPGTNTATIPVSLLVDTGTRPAGSPVAIDFQSGGQVRTVRGRVFHDSSEFAGVNVSLPGDHPVWRAMQSGRAVAFGVSGGPSITVPGDRPTTPVIDFLQRCRS